VAEAPFLARVVEAPLVVRVVEAPLVARVTTLRQGRLAHPRR
jgi:hypothetical protein